MMGADTQMLQLLQVPMPPDMRTLANQVPDRFGQFQEPQSIGHDSAGFAYSFGDFFLCELKLADQVGVTDGFLNRIEVLPLEILDQSEFNHLPVSGLADDDWGFHQSGQLGGSPGRIHAPRHSQ